MKHLYIILIALAALPVTAFSQQIPGAPPDAHLNPLPAPLSSGINSVNVEWTTDSNFIYRTTSYTFSDLVVFSYTDSTKVRILNSSGAVVDSVTLQQDNYHVFSPGAGLFIVEANHPFSLLIGDPISREVLGFFAVDQSGSPLSTRLNTYFPDSYYGGELFIVFAYEDETEFQIINLTTNTILASGVLNRGEHYAMGNHFGTFLGVTANKPVSALSYTDQGYYIPATNGTFAGKEFFGYSAKVGGWPNGVIVVAYHDSTEFIILNSTTGDTVAVDTLNTGEVFAQVVTNPLYWQVISTKPVTVCNSPYAYFNGAYYHLIRQIDETGRGIGTNFYAPVIAGDLNVFSYEDNNTILILDTSNGDTLANITLNQGENYSTYLYSKTVLHITGTKNLSVISSNGGGWGADFMPLNYTLQLPDLVVRTQNIKFVPDKTDWTPGESVTIYATVTNQGNVTAKSVQLQFFDGPPEAGNTISQQFSLDSLQAGDSARFATQWTIPEKPEYHKVYVKAYLQTGQESNTDNNVAARPLVPNNDLQPPLSTTIKAPATVKVSGDTTEFREFDLTVVLFNAGDTTAFNARAILHLPPEWSVVSSVSKVNTPLDSTVDDTIRYFGDILEKESDSYTWRIRINDLPSGKAYYYSVDVLADNAPQKNVKGMMQVEQPTAIEPVPALNAPTHFELLPAFPNPFNPSTIIPFRLAERSPVELSVYNLAGQKVAVLVQETLSAGDYRVTFNASGLSNGIYFVRLKAGPFTQTRKIVLMK